ncbi:probable transcription factor At1g61730 [Cajanus cajan]|nr:probable transcription factor At1g61730 [Cajanus cajan]
MAPKQNKKRLFSTEEPSTATATATEAPAAQECCSPKVKAKRVTKKKASSDEETEEDRIKAPDGQSKLFQRIWSEEDEVLILKGMAEFISSTGNDPYKHADSFHDSIKNMLHVAASINQLKEKIRRLKKKFEANSRRGKNGDDPHFSKPHDSTMFHLSKMVWAVKPRPSEKQLVTVKSLMGNDLDSLYLEIAGMKELGEDEMKKGLALIGESKRKELEGRWSQLRLAQLQLVSDRSQLTGEIVKLIHEALH